MGTRVGQCFTSPSRATPSRAAARGRWSPQKPLAGRTGSPAAAAAPRARVDVRCATTAMAVHVSRARASVDDAEETYREVCERCRRAKVVCVCDAVSRVLNADGVGMIRNSTEILILQDRHEFRRALGSAVCCSLALEKCEVKWYDIREDGGAKVPIPGAGTLDGLGVLWPDESAIDLDDYCAMPVESRAPLNCLIVLDTTWSRAKAMYYSIPWLAQVPKYVIAPRRRSNYRIRKQPKEYCLSTAECVAQALSTLEPDSRAHLVADCFDGMIDDQLEAESRALRAPRMRARVGSKALRRAKADGSVR